MRRQVKTHPEQPRHKSPERQEAARGLQVEAKSIINTYKFHKMFSSLLSVSLGSGCFEECVWGSCRGCAAPNGTEATAGLESFGRARRRSGAVHESSGTAKQIEEWQEVRRDV